MIGWEALGGVVALIAILLTVFLEWDRIKGRFSHIRTKFRNRTHEATRRSFLRIGVASTALVAVGSGAILLRNRNKAARQQNGSRNHPASKKVKVPPLAKYLVRNKKTGVIHHADSCRKHLPEPQNIEPVELEFDPTQIHKHVEANTLLQISQHFEDEERIALLKLAIKKNPTAIHVYDKLIKEFGRLRMYTSIHSILEDGRIALDTLSNSEKSPSRKRRLVKLISDIEARQIAARDRKKEAIES